MCHPPLHLILVQSPYHPGSLHNEKQQLATYCMILLQDFLSKWPMVYAVPNQKTTCIAHLLVEVVPCSICGVPETVLDRGTNLLSHLIV